MLTVTSGHQGTDDLAFPVPQIEEVRDALSGVKEMDYHTITGEPPDLELNKQR